MNAVFPHAVLRVFRVGIFLLLFLFFFSTARAIVEVADLIDEVLREEKAHKATKS